MADLLADALTGVQLDQNGFSVQNGGWKARVVMDYDESTGQSVSTAAFARYEFNDPTETVGADIESIRERLFKDCKPLQDSILALNMMAATVDCKGPVEIRPFKDWDKSGINQTVKQNLGYMKYDKPTPIQAFVVPAMMSAYDVMAISKTGSGKTAAYLLPIINKLMIKSNWIDEGKATTDNARVQAIPLALVTVPTRELAIQIFKEACRLAYRSKIRCCVVYGGSPRLHQIEDLQKGCDLLIGTPGRLIDLVENCPTSVSLRRLKWTVLDEADEMLRDEWSEDLERIVKGHLRRVAKRYLSTDRVRFTIGRIGSTHECKLDVVECLESNKLKCIEDLLRDPRSRTRTVIFCNHNERVDRVEAHLYKENFPVAAIHSGRTQMERERSFNLFDNDDVQILVCSGIGARGLDFHGVRHVINFDLPKAHHGGITEFVHRAGRTNRGGLIGQATSFWDPDSDVDLAPALVSILVETGNIVPDFLEEYRRVDDHDNPVFDDSGSESEDEDTPLTPATTAAANDAWGAPSASEATSGDGWGTASAGISNDGWGISNDSAAASIGW